MIGLECTAEGAVGEIPDVIRRLIPNAPIGVFELTGAHADACPADGVAFVREKVGHAVLVFALPITDEGYWIWAQVGKARYLMANQILQNASAAALREARRLGVDGVDVAEATDDALSMVSLAEFAGLGNRGWNNLLLHPMYGSWIQLAALALDVPLRAGRVSRLERVCTECARCIAACPVEALAPNDFSAVRCASVVASPWRTRSKARAMTAFSYVECAECISSCPIGDTPQGVLDWR